MSTESLKLSGLQYDPEQKIAKVMVDGQEYSFHSETSPTKAELLAYGETLAKPDQAVEVTDMPDEEKKDEEK